MTRYNIFYGYVDYSRHGGSEKSGVPSRGSPLTDKIIAKFSGNSDTRGGGDE